MLDQNAYHLQCLGFCRVGVGVSKNNDDRIQAGLNFMQSSESRQRVVFTYFKDTINYLQKCLQKSRRYV